MTKKKTEEHWDLPEHRQCADLKVGETVWVGRCYRKIREIKENEEGRLLLLEGMSYPVLVPTGDYLWWMEHARPDIQPVPEDTAPAQEETTQEGAQA